MNAFVLLLVAGISIVWVVRSACPTVAGIYIDDCSGKLLPGSPV